MDGDDAGRLRAGADTILVEDRFGLGEERRQRRALQQYADSADTQLA